MKKRFVALAILMAILISGWAWLKFPGGETQTPADTTPPVISNIQVSSISSTSATVTWTTNEASTSVVKYGLTSDLGSQASSTTNVISHAVALSGLRASTEYYYVVNSSDATGNSAQSAQSSFTTTQAPFPHIAIYSGVASTGWPFTGTVENKFPPKDAPINPEVVDQYSRNSMLVLSVTPLADMRPDILEALRARNPENLIGAYVPATWSWCPLDTYPEGTFWRNYWAAIEQFDGNDGDVYADCKISGPGFLWLYGAPAEQIGGFPLVNLAYRELQPNGTYRYPIAEALPEVIFRDIYERHKFDGIFLDGMGDDNLWMEPSNCFAVPITDPTGCFDYARAGYNSSSNMHENRAAFAAGYKTGDTRFMEHLRELIDSRGGARFPIIGNGGPGPTASYPFVNGWMRENFPYQNGGSFFTNLFRQPYGGYLFEDILYRSPQHNFVFSAAPNPANPNDPDNILRMRFGLASASLGNGWAVFSESSMDPRAAPFFQWWYDEYGVNLTTGQASAERAHRGYLGLPLGEFRQMIAPNPNPELMAGGSFESDLGDYQFLVFSPANATSEFVTAGSPGGGKALHVTVSNPGQYAWQVNLQSKPTATFNVTAYTEYGVTFWAKALDPGTLTVAINNGVLSMPLTAEWKQYQFRVKPTNSVQTAVRLDLARAGQEIWLDDLHVQQGVTSVYRRDFENGIVLVNPNDSDQTVTLEGPFRKILGTVDPVWNDGSEITQVNLPGAPIFTGIGSAIFLLRTAPAKVTHYTATSDTCVAFGLTPWAGAFLLATALLLTLFVRRRNRGRSACGIIHSRRATRQHRTP